MFRKTYFWFFAMSFCFTFLSSEAHQKCLKTHSKKRVQLTDKKITAGFDQSIQGSNRDFSVEKGNHLTFQFESDISISDTDCDKIQNETSRVFVTLFGQNEVYCEGRFIDYPMISDNHIKVTYCYTTKRFKASFIPKLAGNVFATNEIKKLVVKRRDYGQWVRIRLRDPELGLNLTLSKILYYSDDENESFIVVETFEENENHKSKWSKLEKFRREKDKKSAQYVLPLHVSSVNISFKFVSFSLEYQSHAIEQTPREENVGTGSLPNKNKKDGIPVYYYAIGGGCLLVMLAIIIAVTVTSNRRKQREKQGKQEAEKRNKRVSELEGEYFGFEGPKNQFSFPDVPFTGERTTVSGRPPFPAPKERFANNTVPYDPVAGGFDHNDNDEEGYACINDLNQPRKSLRREVNHTEQDAEECYEKMSYYDQVCHGSSRGSIEMKSLRRPSHGYTHIKKVSRPAGADPCSSLPDLLESDHREKKFNIGIRGATSLSGAATADEPHYVTPRPSDPEMSSVGAVGSNSKMHSNFGRVPINNSIKSCSRYDSPRPSVDEAKLLLQQRKMSFGHYSTPSHYDSPSHYDTAC